MPYGVDDSSKMQSTLAGIRAAFGSQPDVQPDSEDEQLKLARLQALQRVSAGNPQVNPDRARALMAGFSRNR